jgi:ParB family chromosome partitioning protein
MTTRKIADIKVTKRFRKDMGDLDALAESIRQIGLIQPISIWGDNTLACGERRLRAVQKLGWIEVPVHVLADGADLLARLQAERDENTCRKNFLPSEAVAIGQGIEARLKAQAKGRQEQAGKAQGSRGKEGGRGKKKEQLAEEETPWGNFPQGVSENGRSLDQIGATVGMSGKTYEKARAIALAALEQPELFGDLAARMDLTGKIDGAFRELEKRRHPEPPLVKPRYPHSDCLTKWLHFVSGQTFVIEIEMGGMPALLQEPQLWDWRDVEEYLIPQLEDLSERIDTYLKEIKHGARQQKGS